MSKNILIICPHDDDESVGMMGTLLKYTEEGNNIIKIILSSGEMSHPHLKKEVISEIRKKETKKIAKNIGIKELIFFDLPDATFQKKINQQKTKEKLKRIINKYKPNKIFTVSDKDTHPQHRIVNKVVLGVVDSIKTPYPVYTFQVWNIFTENLPELYINISDYFREKIRVMKQHKSQWASIYLQLIPVYFRAKLNGIKHGCKYAEIFYKIR